MGEVIHNVCLRSRHHRFQTLGSNRDVLDQSLEGPERGFTTESCSGTHLSTAISIIVEGSEGYIKSSDPPNSGGQASRERQVKTSKVDQEESYHCSIFIPEDLIFRITVVS